MFTVNSYRFDPYRTFKFQVIIDGRPVAGLRKMTALKKKTETVKWRSAGDPSFERMLPGGTTWEPVTFEHGLSHDLVFESWANLINNPDGDKAMSEKNFRKELTINVLNLQGSVAISYQLHRAWVSEFQALPDMDAGTMNAVAIQHIVVSHEGFWRIGAVPEPTET